MTFADEETTPLSQTLNQTFSGLHPPTVIKFTLILTWIYFVVCLVTAFVEKPYHVLKGIIIYGSSGFLLFYTTQNFLTLFAETL